MAKIRKECECKGCEGGAGCGMGVTFNEGATIPDEVRCSECVMGRHIQDRE